MEAAVANAAAAERVLQLSLLEDVVGQRQCAYEKCGKWFKPTRTDQKYCRIRCGRLARSKAKAEAAFLAGPQERKCKGCPTVFPLKNRHQQAQKFWCDDAACRKRAEKRAAQQREPEECVVCGEEFVPATRKTVWCSTACYHKLYKQVGRAGGAAVDAKEVLGGYAALKDDGWYEVRVPGTPLPDGHVKRDEWRERVASVALGLEKLPDEEFLIPRAASRKITYQHPNGYPATRALVGVETAVECYMIHVIPHSGRSATPPEKVNTEPEKLHHHTTTPDEDNLFKSALEGLKEAKVYYDDCVVTIRGGGKFWKTTHWKAGVVIRFRRAEEAVPGQRTLEPDPYELLAKAGFWTGDRDKFPGDHEWLPDKDVI